MEQETPNSVLEVAINLPFLLRLDEDFEVPYGTICPSSQIEELSTQTVHMKFSRYEARRIDNSGMTAARTRVVISVYPSCCLSDEAIGTFAICDCLEIVNRIILSYQAATGAIGNAGFITPLGRPYMMLFAEIRHNDEDVRDRWPFQGINTLPLDSDAKAKFSDYLCGGQLPLSRVLLTNGRVLCEGGQYALAVLQAAMAVEVGLSQFMTTRLEEAQWPSECIKEYDRQTLGGRLRFKPPDMRSLETHFQDHPQCRHLLKRLRKDFIPLRNRIVHRGYLPSRDETDQILEVAGNFLRLISTEGV